MKTHVAVAVALAVLSITAAAAIVVAQYRRTDDPLQCPLESKEPRGGGAVTGKLFTGDVFRATALVKQKSPPPTAKTCGSNGGCKVPVVGVTTTLKAHTECISIVAQHIPVVVVGDNGSQPRGQAANNVRFLSLEDQHRLFPALSKALPTQSFARKNIGLVYAYRTLCACAVFDFDDDNCPGDGAIGQVLLGDRRNIFGAPDLVLTAEDAVVNPYLLYGPPVFTWPRGFPLENLSKHEFPWLLLPPVANKQHSNSNSNDAGTIDVLQLMQNRDPDTDANWRLLYGHKELPLYWFSSPAIATATVAIHPARWAPFNAQSTLLSQRVGPLSYLPHTVHGRVSDIWRAYIMQYFMKRLSGATGLLAFSGHFVDHRRNSHNYLADRQAETHVAERVGVLVNYLAQRPLSTTKATVESEYPVLVDDLYRRGFVERDDVACAALWVEQFAGAASAKQKLVERAFVSPPPPKTHNVTAVVHINREHREVVPVWYAIHGRHFRDVRVYVPGNASAARPISGITLYSISADKKGWFAYESALHTLETGAITSAATAGMLFVHDDTTWKRALGDSIFAPNASSFVVMTGVPLTSIKVGWASRPSVLETAKNFQSKYYPTKNITFLKETGDEYFVAERDIATFARVARQMMQSQLNLEITIPTLFENFIEPLGLWPLYTRWDSQRRITAITAPIFCSNQSVAFAHPMKLSTIAGIRGHLC